METEHEKMLQIAIKEMKLQGYRVIRLDRRIVPDAIAINEKEIVAIESDTTFTGVAFARRRLENSQYDAEIVVTKPLDQYYFEPDIYKEVIKLMNEGHSFRETRKIAMEKFHLKSLSIATIHNWLKDRCRPPSLKH